MPDMSRLPKEVEVSTMTATRGGRVIVDRGPIFRGRAICEVARPQLTFTSLDFGGVRALFILLREFYMISEKMSLKQGNAPFIRALFAAS
jgi:hypothetical protein